MESGILRAGRVLGAESRRSEEAGPGPQCGGLNSTDQVPWGGFGFGEAGSLVGGEFQLRVRHSHLPDPHSISLSHTHTSSTVGLCPAGASVSQHKQTPPYRWQRQGRQKKTPREAVPVSVALASRPARLSPVPPGQQKAGSQSNPITPS